MFSLSGFERWVWPLAGVHFDRSSFLERDCFGGGGGYSDPLAARVKEGALYIRGLKEVLR